MLSADPVVSSALAMASDGAARIEEPMEERMEETILSCDPANAVEMTSNGTTSMDGVILEAIQNMQQFMEAWRKEQLDRNSPSLGVRRSRETGSTLSPEAQYQSQDDLDEDQLELLCLELGGVDTDDRMPVRENVDESCDDGMGPEKSAESMAYGQQKTKSDVSIGSTNRVNRESLTSVTPISLKNGIRLNYGGSPLRLWSGEQMRTISSFMKEKPPTPSGCLKQWVMGGKSFEVICSIVIACNAVFMAWRSNREAHYLYEPTDKYQSVELFFCAFYTLELSLRIYTLRCRYYLCPDWRWNACDTLLVITSIQEQIALLMTSDKNNTNLSFLRILRLLKMVRLLRMVRLMRAFREFRVLFNSIAGSLKAAVWAISFIVVMNFMFSLCILQGVTDYMRTDPMVSDQVRDTLVNSWGSLSRSMISMYMATSAGVDWKDVGDVLYIVGSEYYFVFVFYVAVYNTVTVNTITSLFVEATIAFAEKDTSSMITDKLQRQGEYVRKLRSWFVSIDKEGRGEINFKQFVENANNAEVLGFADTLDLDLVDLKRFFGILSRNGTRPVDLEHFVLGCMKLKGIAKSMDVISLLYAHRDATKENKATLKRIICEVECLKRDFEEFLASRPPACITRI